MLYQSYQLNLVALLFFLSYLVSLLYSRVRLKLPSFFSIDFFAGLMHVSFTCYLIQRMHTHYLVTDVN